jgi:hypothetical protein
VKNYRPLGTGEGGRREKAIKVFPSKVWNTQINKFLLNIGIIRIGID